MKYRLRTQKLVFLSEYSLRTLHIAYLVNCSWIFEKVHLFIRDFIICILFFLPRSGDVFESRVCKMFSTHLHFWRVISEFWQSCHFSSVYRFPLSLSLICKENRWQPSPRSYVGNLISSPCPSSCCPHSPSLSPLPRCVVSGGVCPAVMKPLWSRLPSSVWEQICHYSAARWSTESTPLTLQPSRCSNAATFV